MKYNERYDLYLDDDFVIYYWNKHKDKLMQRPLDKDKDGYLRVLTKIGKKRVHRVIYETFVGTIPDGYEIDHINNIRNDNRLENLRCVTHKENMNNPISLKARRKAMCKPWSEFGRKFKDHYGISCQQNPKLYNTEQMWYYRHNNKCRWEV